MPPRLGLQYGAWCAAFWMAVLLFGQETPSARERRWFVVSLVLGAILAHAGWTSLQGEGERFLADPTRGFSILFAPLGPFLLAPGDRGARAAFRARAASVLPLALAVARSGCCLAGCCHGRALTWGFLERIAGRPLLHPTALYETMGLVALHGLVARGPLRSRASRFALGFGLLRALLEGLRAPPPGSPRIDVRWIAGAWVLLGLVGLALAPRAGTRVAIARRGSPRRSSSPRTRPGENGGARMPRVRRFTIRGFALGLGWILQAGAAQASAAPRLLEPHGARSLEERVGRVSAFGIEVGVADGSVLVRRVDLVLDTRLGPAVIGAAYRSEADRWFWGFEMHYDGIELVDATGRRHATEGVAPGEAIPGTVWRVLGPRTLRTRGGWVHEFDATGRLARVHWASGAYPAIVLRPVALGHRTLTAEIVQCQAEDRCEPLFTIERDAEGRVVGVRDRAGRRSSYEWDAASGLVVARDALDRAQGRPGTRYEHIGADLRAVTSTDGERVELTFEAGRIRSVLAPGVHAPQFAFAYGSGESGGAGGWTRVTDPSGFTRVYRYDAQGRLLTRESSLGARTRWTWSGARIVQEIDPAGLVHTWTYQGDELVAERLPTGNERLQVPEPRAESREDPLHTPRTRVEDHLGTIVERSYDERGRLVASTNGAGETTRLGYDAANQLVTVTDPAGGITALEDIGEHGHPGRVTRGGLAVDLEYDAVGDLIRGALPGSPATFRSGGVVSRAFDEDRNLVQLLVTDLQAGSVSESAPVVVEYRGDRKPRAIRRPYGGDIEYRYDGRGHLRERWERVDGAWEVTRFELDALGRLRSVERPNGTRQAWELDAAGRWIRHELWRSGVLEDHAEATYDVAGRLVELRDSAYTAPERLYYDAFGRVALVRHPAGEVTTVRRDARSRPVRVEYWLPGGERVGSLGFAYDGAGREIRILDGERSRIERVFEQGRLAETRYGNGLRRTYDYDPSTGLPAGARIIDAAETEQAITALQRAFCSGYQCVLSSTRTTGTLAARTVDHYVLGPVDYSAYPRAGRRVVMDHRAEAWFDHAADGFYDYDLLSNLTTHLRLGGADAYQTLEYNPERNRLRRVRWLPSGRSVSYATDRAGFVVERDGQALTWDAAGRITEVGSDFRFGWDTLGRPVSRTEPGGEVIHRFGGRVVADPDGRPRSLDLGEVVLSLVDGSASYRHLDARGHVKLVSDDRGRIVTHYGYGAYGVDRVIGSDEDPIRFAQGRALGELVLLGHRLYDPAAARFLAPDPVESLVNAYAYTLGNPVEFWDVDGRFAFDVVSWGMAVAGAGLTMMGFPSGQVVGTVFFVLGMVITVSGLFVESDFGDAASAPGHPAGTGGGEPGSGDGPGSAPGAGGGGSATGGGVGAVPSACAPTGAVHVPHARWVLGALVTLQVVLAWALLRHRSAAGGPRA